jgi:hypothetical protein
MAMPNRKQAPKRAPVQHASRPAGDTRRLDRAARREEAATNKPALDDVLVDRDLHPPAEDIEIDPQLDESEKVEP